MVERAFVDTNVFVYAVDPSDAAKHERARVVLDPLGARDLCISTQVLSEFFVVVTRKLGVEPVTARAMVEQLSRLPVVIIDAAMVLGAIDGSRAWGISYWDALIVRAAEVGGCSRILSEDLADAGRYGSVSIENPFATA